MEFLPVAEVVQVHRVGWLSIRETHGGEIFSSPRSRKPGISRHGLTPTSLFERFFGSLPSKRPFMTQTAVITILTAPVLLAITVGCLLLKRAFARQELLPEELAFAAAWVFVVGSLVWLGVFLNGSTLLGFGSPWTWITAAHFVFAGFGALTVTAFSCRVATNRRALKILRILLVTHPIAYGVTAAGILGYRYCDEVASVSYVMIFGTQWLAVVFGRPTRIPHAPLIMVVVALTVPLVTMVPALAWAWNRPIFDIAGMVRYHGIINAIGHVGLGLAGFLWGRPPSHSEIKEAAHPTM